MLIPYKELIQRHNIHPKSVIHVGGHYGEEAKDYYENGVHHSVWIEANPACIPELIKTICVYPNSHVLNACVSDTEGQELMLNIANNEGQSSSILDLGYHKIAHREVFYTHSIPVKTRTLDKIFVDLGLDNYYKNGYAVGFDDDVLLNADIQGAELLMLKGATTVLPKISCIYLEVNNKEVYTGCGLVEDIDSFLKPYNFVRVETKWCGETGWGDALYLKTK
jgi:FkbM family methyltransferase